MLLMLDQLLPLPILGALGAYLLAPVSTTISAQSTSACSIYRVAIATASDSGSVVVIDSTASGVPMFAFAATSDFARTPAEQGLPLSDSVMQALQAVNEHPEPLRGCLGRVSGVQPVSRDSLMAIFSGDHNGWTRFRARYRGVKRFVLVSRPLALPDSSVLVYVAYASDWLAGAGAILRLQRDSGGHWTRQAQAFLWVS